MKGLRTIVEDVGRRRSQKPLYLDASNHVAADVRTTLSEVAGDFLQTLRDCDKLLNDRSKFRRSNANFVDNVAWHTSTEREVNNLRQRVQFHMIKIGFIAEPFKVHLLLCISRELQQLREDVYDVQAAVKRIPSQIGHLNSTEIEVSCPSVPGQIASRFENALNATKTGQSLAQGNLSLKDGFDAAIFDSNRSTLIGDVVTEEQYVSLLKSRWIIQKLEKTPSYISCSPDSVWPKYLRELDGKLRKEIFHLESANHGKCAFDTISQLPDSCFSIGVNEEPPPRPAALTDGRPLEEKILEIPLEESHATHKTSLTVFRRSETAFRLVSTTRSDGDINFHQAESLDVNMNTTKLISVFPAPQDLPTSNVLIWPQPQDPKGFNLRSSTDVAKFQRALTGYRISHDMSNVSWHIEFRKFRKSGISGKARLQLLQVKPLPKISDHSESPNMDLDSSSSSASPRSLSRSLNLRHFWTSGTERTPEDSIASPVNGSHGDGYAISRPELPVLVLFAIVGKKYNLFHVRCKHKDPKSTNMALTLPSILI